MEKKYRPWLWTLQVSACFKLSDWGVSLILLAYKIYNWNVSKDAQFPPQMIIESTKQKLEYALKLR